MLVQTSRFSSVAFEPEDVILFPAGLIGMPQERRWVLLADASADAVAWLQSLETPDLAVPVVSPRRFVSGYRLRVTRSELSQLELAENHQAFVLGVVAKNGDSLTVNLKAPLVINLDKRLGRQVLATDDQPLRYELHARPASLRKSA